MSTSYELIYFQIHGRAEPIRLLLTLAGQPFTDTVLTREQWKSAKATMPLFQLPVLVEKDARGERRIPQSQAILRHLARTFRFDGADEEQRVRADVVAETCVDIAAGIGALLHGAGKGNAELADKYWNETWKTNLAKLGNLLASAPAGADGLFVAATPTYADVNAFQLLHTHLAMRPACLDGAPELRRFHDRMAALPQWQSYLGTRRKSEATVPG
ncbi:MAG: glutathione S-transferase family protein [Deltaproteobacteria bacterium]|nr:glutathione S-transferase family protein [Deltaproteobacteria bacterium]